MLHCYLLVKCRTVEIKVFSFELLEALREKKGKINPQGIQGDQLNMAVCFWYLVKRELSSVRYIGVTFYKVPEEHRDTVAKQCPSSPQPTPERSNFGFQTWEHEGTAPMDDSSLACKHCK